VRLILSKEKRSKCGAIKVPLTRPLSLRVLKPFSGFTSINPQFNNKMKKTIFCGFLLGLTMLTGCTEEEITKPVQLDYYIESYEIPDLGFEPQLKVSYEYNTAGQLSKYTVSSYHPDQNALIDQRYFVFEYTNNQVSAIEGFLPDASNSYISYVYEYLPNGKVSKIAENNQSAGITSEANFTYDPSKPSIKVFYTFSNGGSFEYAVDYANENIVSDKTTRGSQACSDGQYTYDQFKNPFKHLGYVDYLLTNLSANNKLSESINYVGCSFPTLIPETYSYEYNEQGYPTISTTLYKSGGALVRSQKKFFYK
jgi:hypothetical protein